ncbi:ketosynthase chain-length factor [Streptomyces sp. MST-110588]|nr:ketosynthase chain-length factor [Streptomyces sp. MST-110588]
MSDNGTDGSTDGSTTDGATAGITDDVRDRTADGTPGPAARAYVTGIGLLAPNGLGLEPYWEATLEGRTGIAPVTRFDVSRYPVRLAGQITRFEAGEHLPSRLLPQTDISTRFALVAADWALADAKIEPDAFTDYDMGVVTSNATGGFEFTHREFKKLWSQGPASVSVYESFAWFYAVNTGQISIRNKLRGPSSALVAEQAGGLDALGHARRTVRRGTPMVVTGGVDSALDPWGWVSQIAGGRLSTVTDPRRAYLPFDAGATGYVPGEGGAILVLEDARAAGSRGAQRVYGEIAGYASTFDPPPGSPRPPGLRRAVEQALADAGVSAGDVDVVFADAAGVPELDRREAAVISGLFGPQAVPVTAPKALTGRLYSGGGPVDVACALLSIRDGVIPPSGGTAQVPEEYRIDLVRTAPRPGPVTTALVLARGKWGFNSAVVVRAVDGADAPAPHPSSHPSPTLPEASDG